MSNEEPDDLWPVLPSEAVQDALAGPGLPVELFSAVLGAHGRDRRGPVAAGERRPRRRRRLARLPVPRGRGLVEYVIDTHSRVVRLTRIVPL